MKKNENEKKSRSEKVVNEVAEVPYPVVPSKKDKDHHLVRILDIFRKLEQMPLYSKFLRDMLTLKQKYIHQENIIVEGNCSAMIQKGLGWTFQQANSTKA